MLSVLFCFSYFSGRVLHFFPRKVSDHPPTYGLLCLWDHRYALSHLADWDRDLTYFLLRLALNCDPPDLCLLSSWDYRVELLYPGLS
jgi:hypothetical protein